jgi:hypothetical protein
MKTDENLPCRRARRDLSGCVPARKVRVLAQAVFHRRKRAANRRGCNSLNSHGFFIAGLFEAFSGWLCPVLVMRLQRR